MYDVKGAEMNNQAELEKLKQARYRLGYMDWADFDECIDQAYQLGLKHAKQEWISVEDRLPEENIEVIGFTDKKEIVYFIKYNKLKDYQWTTSVRCFDLQTITHWMPLPEPPKENE